jgi:glycosyltransferase involved in cell wall biosynthesis
MTIQPTSHTRSAAAPISEPTPLDVTILLPCRNETTTVAICIALALAWISFRNLTGEVLVVDNASSDSSAAQALTAGARVIDEPRVGYGNALRTGIQSAHGRIVIIADADNTYDLTNLDAFYDPIATAQTHDLVIGDRFAQTPSRAAMSRYNHAGNWLLSTLTRTTTGLSTRDIHCGLRAFTRTTMTDLPTWSTGMEFATHMLTHAHRKHLRIAETPITLHPPAAGRHSNLHPLRDGLRHLAAIARESLRGHAPHQPTSTVRKTQRNQADEAPRPARE